MIVTQCPCLFEPLWLIGLSHGLLTKQQKIVCLVANDGEVQCEPTLDIPPMHVTRNLPYMFCVETLALSIPYKHINIIINAHEYSYKSNVAY